MGVKSAPPAPGRSTIRLDPADIRLGPGLHAARYGALGRPDLPAIYPAPRDATAGRTTAFLAIVAGVARDGRGRLGIGSPRRAGVAVLLAALLAVRIRRSSSQLETSSATTSTPTPAEIGLDRRSGVRPASRRALPGGPGGVGERRLAVAAPGPTTGPQGRRFARAGIFVDLDPAAARAWRAGTFLEPWFAAVAVARMRLGIGSP